jgi:hypothetical protein
MADYIYTMEIRLTPDQQRGVILVQDIARDAGMNIYLTGGAVRDIISGFSIRDLDFTVQGNPLKLQTRTCWCGGGLDGRRPEDLVPGFARECPGGDQHRPHRALREDRETSDHHSGDDYRRSSPAGFHR